MKHFYYSIIFVSSFATYVSAETSITCIGETAWNVAQNQVSPLEETIILKFNEREITYVGHVCDRVTANIVNESTLRLVCEIKGTCANGGGPITNFLTVNRMTGKYTHYLSCLGLQTEGTCGKSMPKKF